VAVKEERKGWGWVGWGGGRGGVGVGVRTETVDMSCFRAIARSGMTGHERIEDSR